jgi:hypothetical protein
LIGVCKKTLKLKDHPRFFKTVENCGLQSDWYENEIFKWINFIINYLFVT